jgi:hypothetical protein
MASDLFLHLLGAKAVMNRSVTTGLISCAGIIAASVLWAVNLEVGQILPYSDCASMRHTAGLISLAFVVLSGVSGYVSWRGYRAVAPEARGANVLRFLALLSSLASIVLAFALLLQMTSGFILTGCER